MPNNLYTHDATTEQPRTGWISDMLEHPSTPYFLGAIVWILAWWMQMGPLRPFLNFAPGVELPFFPAGVRTLAVFIFGFPGAVGVFIGSLVTYFLYFPELVTASPLGIASCAAASAFSSYIAMRLVCEWRHIPHTLAGLSLRSISWIVVTQSILSATLHQTVYRQELFGVSAAPVSTSATLLNWAAMASGDALGSMSILLSILLVYQLLFQRAQHH